MFFTSTGRLIVDYFLLVDYFISRLLIVDYRLVDGAALLASGYRYCSDLLCSMLLLTAVRRSVQSSRSHRRAVTSSVTSWRSLHGSSGDETSGVRKSLAATPRILITGRPALPADWACQFHANMRLPHTLRVVAFFRIFQRSAHIAYFFPHKLWHFRRQF